MTSLLNRLFGPSVKDLPEWLHKQQGLKNRFDPDKLIEQADFVAFDTELTGLDFKQDSCGPFVISLYNSMKTSISRCQEFYHF